MLEDKKQNIIYFDNDEEFYNYVVDPNIVIRELSRKDQNGNPVYGMDWKFSELYNKALQNNTIFIIKDEDSQVCKRGAVSFHTVTKPVQNLEQYICED